MSQKSLRAALLAALAVSCASAYAQTAPIGPYRGTVTPTGPLGVRLGDSPFFFAPFFNLGLGYDDNVGLTNNNKTSSPYQVYSPGFLLDARDASRIFQASYQGAFGQ